MQSAEMKKEKKSLLLFIFLYILYSSIYIARMNFSVASVLLEEAGNLTKTQIGIIGSIFSFTYAGMKLPGGYISEKMPSYCPVLVGLLLACIGNTAIGIFPTFGGICLFWFLNAAGQALLWGPILKTVLQSYPPHQSRLLAQFLSSSVATGSIMGLLLAGILSSHMGAAACFLVPGGITLLMAILCWIFFPKTEATVLQKKRENISGEKKNNSLLRVLKEKEFLITAIPSIAHGMIKDNINVWLAIFVADRFSVDIASMAGYILFIPLLGFVGRLLYPLFASALHMSGEKVSLLGFITAIAATIPLLLKGIPLWLGILCLGTISAMISMINVYVLSVFPGRYLRKGGVSFIASLMDVLTYGGAGFGSLLFGVIIADRGYNGMFWIWIAVSAIGGGTMLLLEKLRENEK